MSRNNNKERCPMCYKHCPLKSPRCNKGVKYARSMQREAAVLPVAFVEPAVPSINDTLLMQLRRLSRRLQPQNSQGSSRYRILSLLAERERISQQELKELLGVKSGSLSELLAKLEKKGLIHRKKNEADKRNRDVVLTEEGREWLRGHKPKYPDALQLFSVLSEQEKSQLSTLFDRLLIADALDPSAEIQTEPQPADEADTSMNAQLESVQSQTKEDVIISEKSIAGSESTADLDNESTEE